MSVDTIIDGDDVQAPALDVDAVAVSRALGDPTPLPRPQPGRTP